MGWRKSHGLGDSTPARPSRQATIVSLTESFQVARLYWLHHVLDIRPRGLRRMTFGPSTIDFIVVIFSLWCGKGLR